MVESCLQHLKHSLGRCKCQQRPQVTKNGALVNWTRTIRDSLKDNFLLWASFCIKVCRGFIPSAWMKSVDRQLSSLSTINSGRKTDLCPVFIQVDTISQPHTESVSYQQHQKSFRVMLSPWYTIPLIPNHIKHSFFIHSIHPYKTSTVPIHPASRYITKMGDIKIRLEWKDRITINTLFIIINN